MGITETESFYDGVNRVTSVSSLQVKNRENELPKSLTTTSENGSTGSQIRKMGPICKVAAVFSKSSMDDDDVIDLDKQFKERSSDDDNECMWLSSTISSPSSIFQDNRFSTTSLQLSVDEWLISGLSKLLANSCTLYPEEEVLSLVAPRKTPNAENIFQENSLLKSESLGSSDINSDSVRSSSCSSSSQISDSDRVSHLGSLVNLDGEDSKWISDTELELDNFQSRFSSPSCEGSEVLLSSSDVKQAAYLADFDTDDEPLFWPSEWNLDWKSEKSWKSFSMSPRNYTTKLRTPQKTSSSSKSVRSKFHVTKMESKKGCRRRLEFNSSSTTESKLLELKQRSNNNCIKKNRLVPSRLRNSTKNSMKIVPLEMEAEDLKEAAEDRKFSIPQSNFMDRDFLEDDMTLTSNGDLPIETLLGLGEFDGHEGVDSEFNEDIFSLDDSL